MHGLSREMGEVEGDITRSLDSLFQYILLTEQQASEMNRHLREVKSEIHRCQEEARSLTGRLEEAKATLETKVQRLAEKQCQRLLLKKHQDFLESQKEDLLKEKEELLTMRVNYPFTADK
ncbi:coiled-coil domain-containing protein 172-like [Xenopus tropicalis]|uniref:Coiled-coil domain-containing protein 172 n=1 Tax=Xenopus tropicalis TaxID=8364 RepID=A0A8J1JXB9_XENTR|nr:coiled-coil domain-containing protein 172-like [Xenopus tropicalis]